MFITQGSTMAAPQLRMGDCYKAREALSAPSSGYAAVPRRDVQEASDLISTLGLREDDPEWIALANRLRALLGEGGGK